ncbi:MAG: hypothetical protein CSB01_04420 [Bacteroidia bacterium]|nr:MAG: hypothetical protein CSB01_04420 [Bacteroidia bacterium]
MGKAHIENFDDEKQLLTEKLKLFTDCKKIIYCADEDLVAETISKQFSDKELLTWSRKKNATLQVVCEEQKKTTTHIQYKYQDKTHKIEVPFSNKASVNNVLTCCLAAHSLGLSKEAIAKGVATLEPVAMRLEIKEGLNNCVLINDCYNSDLGALEIALDTINRQQKNQQKTVILSDIYQTGYSKKKLYEKVANLLQQKKIDRLIGIGME